MLMLLSVALAAVLGITLYKRRPEWVVILYLTAWTWLPTAFLQQRLGTSWLLKMQPATWLVVIALVCTVLTNGRTVATALRGRAGLVFLLAIIGVQTALTVSSQLRVDLVLDQLVGPAAAIVLTAVARQKSAKAVLLIARAVLIIASSQALAVLAEVALNRNLFYRGANDAYYAWYSPDTFDRPLGTTAHPLVVALLMASAIPLVAILKKMLWQLVQTALLFAGVLATETRTSFVIASLAVVALILTSRLRAGSRFALAALTSGGAFVLFRFADRFAVFQRLSLTDRSADERDLAYSWFFEHWPSLPAIGEGMGASYRVAADAGLRTSFESSVIQFAIDFGIPVTVLFLLGAVLTVSTPRALPRVPGARLAVIFAFVQTLTFSSLTVQTLVGPMLLCLVALAMPGMGPRPQAQKLNKISSMPVYSSSRGGNLGH